MNNIRIARKAKGLTQKELAAMVGVTQGNLSSWETDRWKPDIDTLKKLCEILECSADYLLGQEQPKQEAASLPVQNLNRRTSTSTLPKKWKPCSFRLPT